MGHNHNDGHHHHHSANKTALTLSFALIFSFMIVELIGGIVTNSLALISDAGHMLSDAVALGLSLFAFKLGEKSSNLAKTYGYRRFEIIAAFINGISLLAISLYIIFEAFRRFVDPPEVSIGMMLIASIGLVVNIIVAFILLRGDTHDNLNIKSAFLHVIGDMLGSIGAIIAGVLIYFFQWDIADPIASVIVAVLILVSSWRVVKDSIHILMEGTPTNLELEKVKMALLDIPGIIDVHDLHIWMITSDFPALSSHLKVVKERDRDDILNNASHMLRNEFHIKHTTLQLEGENFNSDQVKRTCASCN